MINPLISRCSIVISYVIVLNDSMLLLANVMEFTFIIPYVNLGVMYTVLLAVVVAEM